MGAAAGRGAAQSDAAQSDSGAAHEEEEALFDFEKVSAHDYWLVLDQLRGADGGDGGADEVTSAVRRSTAEEPAAQWSAQEMSRYLLAADLVRLPQEAGLLRLLEDALSGCPLPLPWIVVRGGEGQVLFRNQATDVVSKQHPLEGKLSELLGVCRKLLMLPQHLLEQAATALHEGWDEQAQAEYTSWDMVTQEGGEVLYRHCESGQTMREHPVGVLLPAHFLRVGCMSRLKDPNYVAEILGRSGARSDSKPRSAEVRVALVAADEGSLSPEPRWGACARRRPASGTPPKASRASPAKTRKSKSAPRDAKVPTLLQERHAASLRDPSANGGPQWRQQGPKGAAAEFFIGGGDGEPEPGPDVELGAPRSQDAQADELALWYQAL
mmetsp:Transcript_59764/g.175333  ORF Transcript_59764/g.175333 Transcript_59764/m.175333 type:complete len:382 (-) Transcript_59764:75-1220(-)